MQQDIGHVEKGGLSQGPKVGGIEEKQEKATDVDAGSVQGVRGVYSLKIDNKNLAIVA